MELAGNDHNVHTVLERLETLEEILESARQLRSIDTLLESLVGWLTYFHDDTEQSYIAWRGVRAIAEPGERRLGDSPWARIVLLAATLLGRVLRSESEVGQATVSKWTHSDHPVFQRLVLHSVTEYPQLKASLGVGVLLKNDAFALWDLFLRRERERFLRIAGARVPPQHLKRLVGAILVGPPSRSESNSQSESGHHQNKERSVWRLLSKLRLGGAELGELATRRLNQLQERHDWAHAEGYRDELIVSTAPQSALAPQSAGPSADIQSLMGVLSGGNQFEAYLIWSDLVRERPAKALAVLRRFAVLGRWPERWWADFIRRAPYKGAERVVRMRLLAVTWHLLQEASEETLDRLASDLCALLANTSKQIPEEFHPEALRAWDRLWPSSLDRPDNIGKSFESLTRAINHPAGQLAEAILGLLNARRPNKGEQIPTDIRSRMEKQLSTRQPESAMFGHLVLGAHLSFLFFVDEDWTSDYLIPMFSWSNDTAAQVWSAFLYNPRLSPDILASLQENLVEAIRRRSHLPEPSSQTLIAILGELGVENRDWIPKELQTELVASLDTKELTHLALSFGDWMKDEPATAAQKWREAIGPWLLQYWPKDKAKRSPDQTEAMLEMALATGEAFRYSFESTKPLLVEMKDSRIPYLLVNSHSDLIDAEPDTVLDLLDVIVPRQPADGEPWKYYQLGEVLELVIAAKPDLENDPRYRRLRDFAQMT